ncbi:MAG TPA: tolB protein precursor, partial [Mucilaginibacter sp.]
IPYRPKFKLDYLAGSGVGIGVSSFYGTSLSSGIQGVFSDILGRNQIFAAASVNGQIYDSGAAITYVNQTGRWNLGVGVSHIPYLFGLQTQTFPKQTIGGKNVTVLSQNTDIIRNFEDAGRVFTSYPISKTTRFEVSGGASYNSYRVDRYNDIYKIDTVKDAQGNPAYQYTYLNSDKKKISNAEESQLLNYNLKSYALFQIGTALVGDNSFFGVAAPLNGFRYRLEAAYNFGTYKFFSPTIDLRKYVRVEPVTFAARFYGYGRFGDSNGIYPLFIGYPFYIRGYEGQTFYNNNKKATNGFNIDQLSGNRMAIFNFETRLPFTGPEKLAQIKSKFLFTDLNLFFDAGLAWNAGDKIYFRRNPPILSQTPVLDENGNQQVDGNGNPVFNNTYGRVPALSAGISLRVNVFGAFVLEPYFAFPFNRTDISKPVFGLGFTPGW